MLDEADRMLAAGFSEQLAAIESALPAGRQSMLLSATMPQELEQIAGRWLSSVSVRFRVGAALSIARSTSQTVQVSARSLTRKALSYGVAVCGIC